MIETRKELWRINGFVVPPIGSEAIKTWEVAGTGVPWVGMNGTVFKA